MSDIKRVVLTTLEPQKVSEKVVKKHCKTVRIRVPLPESNEDKCPEYSYKDELAAVKKKIKQNGKEVSNEVNNAPNGLDPFGDDNEDDVRRIALEMEAKYGSGMIGGAKKKRKGRKDDYADIGAGYDESDSFIDNTDGYDEIIPPNVTTAQGGFYINSGALEFKADYDATSEVSSSSSDESESEEEEENPNKTKRKRALDTTDEEGDSNHSSHGQKKQNGDKPHISMQQAIKKKLFSTDKIQIKKRKLADEQKNTVKELLREKRTDVNSGDIAKDVLKENKKPMKLSSVDDAIDSVIGRIEEPQKSLEKRETKDEEPKVEDLNKNGDRPAPTIEIELSPTNEQKIEIGKLPENLPADILDIIEKIKQAARDYKDVGKVKFFSGNVNLMLLSLERRCKVLGRSSRVRVYEHLAPFVRCRKETLIKRAKNLVYEDEQKKLKRTINNLKGHIDQLMPALITNHEKECQRVLQKKFSQEAAVNEELKNLKAPRRRFPLHEDMKRMIRDIVSFKKRCLLHEGKSKDGLEDLLTEYLKTNILILWPEGWMSMAVLKKFCTTMAIKTPDPKAAFANASSSKHSQKPPPSSTSTIISYSSVNNLTITPVKLAEKIGEVSNNNVNNFSSKPALAVEKPLDTVLQSTVKPKPVESPPEKIVEPPHKERSDNRQEPKDNGVIVLSSKTKEDSVIQKEKHCQVIDLTDTPVKNSIKEDISRAFHSSREAPTNSDFQSALKTKFPGLSVTTSNTHLHNDRDDVQKVMESLKALQKLSSPSKSEVATSPAVSVIAFNKNYSNSNSSHGSGVNNERTNFTGAIGFQDEFQKQFISSLNHKSPPPAPPSKSGYNRCS